VIDPANRPESGLVLGEVVTLPGRWSSYPPHQHAQPAVYHFRFTLPQGFGHAELDEEVVKVRPYDTLKVMEQRTHAQVAAPGYGMYSLWVMRHLRDRSTVEMETDAEHSWVLDPRTQGWESRL
jgi:5-deoxy-glucuronate isomerase